jgi:hypothetical protein
MGKEQGSQFLQGTFNWGAEVKPQGPGARAELPIAKPASEHPRFGERVMEAIGFVAEIVTETNCRYS